MLNLPLHELAFAWACFWAGVACASYAVYTLFYRKHEGEARGDYIVVESVRQCADMNSKSFTA